MKELFEQVIQRKDYDLKSLLNCIDQYHIEGKLTDDERQELTQTAREGATAEYDYAGEIDALWAAVRALQQSISSTAEEDEWPEYVQPAGAGTAYQVGDKVTYNGTRNRVHRHGRYVHQQVWRQRLPRQVRQRNVHLCQEQGLCMGHH